MANEKPSDPPSPWRGQLKIASSDIIPPNPSLLPEAQTCHQDRSDRLGSTYRDPMIHEYTAIGKTRTGDKEIGWKLENQSGGYGPETETARAVNLDPKADNKDTIYTYEITGAASLNQQAPPAAPGAALHDPKAAADLRKEITDSCAPKTSSLRPRIAEPKV